MIDKLFDAESIKTEIVIDVQHEGLITKRYAVVVRHDVPNGYKEHVLGVFLSSAIGDKNAKTMAEFFKEKIMQEINF